MSEPPSRDPEDPASSPEPPSSPPDGLGSRLDPDLASSSGPEPAPPQTPAPAIDTRPYRWAIGIFGLALVVGLSVYGFVRNGVVTPGVAAGKPLHRFVAPLATSGVNLDANARPRCDPRRPNPQGLNVCGHAPIVLAFFVTGTASCTRQVDALQAVSGEREFRSLRFAAIAVHASRHDALTDIRHHGWTIPVAYDADGSVGDLYGVDICPLVELAGSDGVVVRRLIGEHWSSPAALAVQARALLHR